MSLSPGARVGSYHVLTAIGAGGMGQVYRARDTRLNRDVALKILPDRFADDRDWLARFEREAQLLAGLNHPNIAQVHAIESTGTSPAIVMELVEGPTLADRLARGRLQVDEALAIARQIAHALEAAHERSVIHRDLKPANIKVREDGTVKVLDFGLAKALDAGPAASGTQSPTITSPAMTERGMILGTAAYMSPEQARGKPVDRRADIWAFGCVLYEMLTGRRAFHGEETSDTLAFVLAKEVDWNALPPNVPQPVRTILKSCLQKDPRLRLRDIGDVRLGLDAAPEPEAATARETPPITSRRWPIVWASVALVVGSVLGAVAAMIVARQRPAAPPSLFVEGLPNGRTFPAGTMGTGMFLAVSPDGSRLAYVAEENGPFRLFSRSFSEIDKPTAVPIGEPNARDPFFSPDGQWIGYRLAGAVWRVPATGGPSQRIVTLPPGAIGFQGMTWSQDHTILLGAGRLGLLRVPEGGGEFEALIAPSSGLAIWYPQALPGGRAVLYTESASRPDAGELRVLDFSTRSTKVLRAGAAGRYLPSGHLVFVAEGSWWAVEFDLDRLEIRGTPVPMFTGVRVDPEGGAAHVAASDTGLLAYVPATTAYQRTLVWVDRKGVETPVGVPPRVYSNPRISPDGSRIAVTMRDGGQDVFIWDRSRSALRQLTLDPQANNVVTWLDAERVAYSGEREGMSHVFVQRADGSDQPRQVTTGVPLYPFSSGGRGTHVIASQYPLSGGSAENVRIDLSAPDKRTVLAPTPSSELNPTLSPDGRWLAYQSNRTGRFEVFVRPYPEVDGGEFQITTDGGTRPVWAKDTSELYYWTGTTLNASIHAVRVTAGSPSSWGTTRELFSGPYVGVSTDTPYDVWGDRFLMMKNFHQQSTPPRHEIVLVLNGLDELTRRVPTR